MAKVEVEMPQMGESVMEGTVIEWAKKVGDKVEVDETLLEIATDKVDTEVPSPESGVLVEILVEEDETVEVGQVIAIIDTEGVASESSDKPEESDDSDEEASTEYAEETAADSEKEAEDESDKKEEETEKAAGKTGDSSSEDEEGERIEVEMPQMGESVMEGTVIEWAKKVGDKVEVDETLLEIATDKVDTEVPSPESGVLVEILVEEDETVEVGQVIAIIDTEGEASESSDKPEESDDSDEEASTEDAEETAADSEKEAEDESDKKEEETKKTAEKTGGSANGDEEGERIEVEMPQMGESVMEGTVIEWAKKVGDKVEVDETLLEIATDKVDTEVPSPESGVLVEILVEEDETVEVGQVIAIIDTEGEASESNDESDESDNSDEETSAEEATGK